MPTKHVDGYEVHSYIVTRWLPDDKGPGVTLAFMQDGSNHQMHLLMSDPLAWQIASEILALLDVEPLPPERIGELG